MKIITYVYHHKTEYESSDFIQQMRERLESALEQAKCDLLRFEDASTEVEKIKIAYETYYGSGDDGIVKIVAEDGVEIDAGDYKE